MTFPTPAPDARSARWKDVFAIALAVLIFSGLSIWLGYHSESDLEADATTHFMMSRFALREHQYFTSVWGRPLCTAAYCLTAQLGNVEQGRFGARLTSLAMALFIAMISYAIARGQRIRRPALAVIFVLAQPIFFFHSFSELTEIPFDVILIPAFLAYQRRQWFWMSLLVGILPLGRPEGFGFILMAAAALIAHRRIRWLWVLAMPFVLWNYIGFLMSPVDVPPGAGRLWWVFNTQWPMWVMKQWPYSYQSMYGRGNLFAYVARLPMLVGPMTFPFVLIGLGLALALLLRPSASQAKPLNGKSEFVTKWVNWLRDMPHIVRCEIWIAIIPLSILIVHSILWWRGKMGSDGELRYLVIVGPFFALAGARGWEWVWSRYRWNAPVLFAGIAAALPIAANFYYRVVPLTIYDEGIISREVANWYSHDAAIRAAYPRIMPTPPGVLFYMDLSQTDSAHVLDAAKKDVLRAPPGTVLIWDPVYGSNNASAEMCTTEEEIRAAGWIYFTVFESGDTYCEVFLSPKTAAGKPTVLPEDPNAFRLFTVPGIPPAISSLQK